MVKKKYQEQRKPSFQLKQQKQNGQNFKAQTNLTKQYVLAVLCCFWRPNS